VGNTLRGMVCILSSICTVVMMA